ncbi:hypothetical protein [Ralstonia phage RP13]|nr:hypothetical protein [Ralstonia phage RP13]
MDNNKFSQSILRKADPRNHLRTPANARYIKEHVKTLTPLEIKELNHVINTKG